MVEMETAQKKSKNQQPNWTPDESEVVTNECVLNPWIDRKFSDTVSQSNKNAFWKTLSSKVSAVGICYRSPRKCKKRWANLRSRATKSVRTYSKESKLTGGGYAPDKPTEEDFKISSGLAVASLTGVPGGIDSDSFFPNARESSVVEPMDEQGSTWELFSPKTEASLPKLPSEAEFTEVILEDQNIPTFEEKVKGRLALAQERLREKRRPKAQQTMMPLSKTDPRRDLVETQSVYYKKKTEILEIQTEAQSVYYKKKAEMFEIQTEMFKLQTQLLKRQLSAQDRRNENIIHVEVVVGQENSIS